MHSFNNDTPSLQPERVSSSFFVRRSHDKKARGRTLTPSQDARRSLQTTSFKLLDSFLSQINFSPAAILQEKEIPSPSQNKESPVFIQKIPQSSSSKSKRVVSSLDNLPDTPNEKRKTIGRLEFSNKKELPSSLDAIPEATDFELEELNLCVRRERGSSVDSGMKGLAANRYRRRAEPGMFMKRKKMTSIENIIEEVEEISTYRGRKEEGDENNSRIRQDFDDDSEEEWRCTSSSSFIISKLSRNTSRIEDYNKGNLDKELFDFIKKRMARKDSRALGRQDKEVARESFSQELLKMKDAIENALIRCHESSKDFIINASP